MIIGGRILDETGSPLPGTNIYSTTMVGKGTISDIDGNWQMSVYDNDVIGFSFMGYKKLVIKVADIPSTIRMEVDSTMINNVTVVGKRTRPKPQRANMDLVGKLLFGALILGAIAKAIPGIMADNKQEKRGLKGFSKVSL